MNVKWNDEEDHALDYLPHEAQIVYLRGIRRRMDYKTGIAGGSKAPISYSWLASLLEVRPEPGSTKRPPPKSTKAQIVAILHRLERAGLVEWVRGHGERTLIFRCVLASVDQSVSERSNTGATQEQHIRNNTSYSSKTNSIDDSSNIATTPCCSARNNQIPVSGYRKTKDCSTNNVDFGLSPSLDRADSAPADGDLVTDEPTPPATKPEPKPDPVQEVFAYWQQVMGKPRTKLDAKRKRAIAGRLKDGYAVQELMRAVDGCKASEWHQGKNDRKTVYDDIELICRSAANLDRFFSVLEQNDRKQREIDEFIYGSSSGQTIEGEYSHAM